MRITNNVHCPFLPWTEGRRCVVNVTAWARTWRTRRTSCPPPPSPCPAAPPSSSWLTSADSTPQLLNSRTWLHGKLSCGAWSQIQSPSSTQQRQDSRIQPGGRAALVWSWFTNCKCRKRLLESLLVFLVVTLGIFRYIISLLLWSSVTHIVCIFSGSKHPKSHLK